MTKRIGRPAPWHSDMVAKDRERAAARAAVILAADAYVDLVGQPTTKSRAPHYDNLHRAVSALRALEQRLQS